MFMAAGLIYAALGHDRIAGLGGIGRALPMSVLAFALAGVALIGVPPSGAYLAKELLLRRRRDGTMVVGVVIQAGGILTSSYVLLVLAHALAPADKPVTPRGPDRAHARSGSAGARAVFAAARAGSLGGVSSGSSGRRLHANGPAGTFVDPVAAPRRRRARDPARTLG